MVVSVAQTSGSRASMSIGRTPTRFGISAGDSRAFLMFNFTISATTSRAGA